LYQADILKLKFIILKLKSIFSTDCIFDNYYQTIFKLEKNEL